VQHEHVSGWSISLSSWLNCDCKTAQDSQSTVLSPTNHVRLLAPLPPTLHTSSTSVRPSLLSYGRYSCGWPTSSVISRARRSYHLRAASKESQSGSEGQTYPCGDVSGGGSGVTRRTDPGLVPLAARFRGAFRVLVEGRRTFW